MRTLSHLGRFVRRFCLQFVFTLLIVSLALGGVFVGSFVCHFLWAFFTGARIRSVEDAPLWLIPPAFIIAGVIVWFVARWLRLFERMFTIIKRYDT